MTTISHVKISNILGIKELEFSPEGFTEISGPNGAGKSSILEAIKAAVAGGHDATLLRKGEKKGEIVLVLDDGMEVRRSVTADGSNTAVARDGKKLTAPAAALRKLTDMLSVNPVEFLRAPAKDRVKVLLEAMPIDVDPVKLEEISGVPVTIAPGVHGLHAIEAVRVEVFNDRTGTNRAIKEKEGTINQLRVAMPDLPEAAQGNVEELEARIAEEATKRDAEYKRIDTKLAGLRTDSQVKIDGFKTAGQAEIDAIRQRVQGEIDAERAALAETEAKAGQQRAKTGDRAAAVIQPATAMLQAIRANASAHAKRQQTEETIVRMQEELDVLVSDAEAQTQALKDIEAYKSELLANLPIPGLEVKDGEVFRDGIVFDRLNTAQQVGIAFEVAKLRAGELGVVCIDGLELMDAAHMQEMRERASDYGLQMFVTRVEQEGEFAIKTAE